jgi:hypothetical protein
MRRPLICPPLICRPLISRGAFYHLFLIVFALGVKSSMCLAQGISGQAARGASVDIPLRGTERFQLKANDVQLTWVVVSGPTLKVYGLSASQGKRHGDLLFFDLKEMSSKEEFSTLAKKKGTPLKIEIHGPSMPIDLNLRDGQIALAKMNHEVLIQMISGSIVINQSKGPFQLRLHKGQISVQDSSGKTGVELYSGQVTLKDVSDSVLNIFSGNLNIQGLQGNLALNTQSVIGKVAGMSGTLTLDSQKGSLHLTQFHGRLEGQTVEGLVSAQILPESEVQLKGKKGRFNFQVPTNSGAYLNLWTGEGEIFVPKELNVVKSALEKSVKGRLRGESQKITISAKTSEGTVVVK